VRDSHDLLPGSLADQPVDVGEPEEPANAVIIVLTEETCRPLSPRYRM